MPFDPKKKNVNLCLGCRQVFDRKAGEACYCLECSIHRSQRDLTTASIDEEYNDKLKQIKLRGR